MSANEHIEDLRDLHDDRFAADVDRIIREAEHIRLSRSKKLSERNKTGISIGISLMVLLSMSFLWILTLSTLPVFLAFIFLAMIFAVPYPLYRWTVKPIKEYRDEYKARFLPKLAKLLGNMQFHPQGGISMKAIYKSGVIPPHDKYVAEDSFSGRYKDTKILLSEARLYSKKSSQPFFTGIFVLLHANKKKFKGHTIITSDDRMVSKWREGRWKKLFDVNIRKDINCGQFRCFATNVEEGIGLADADMMELMINLSNLFEDSRLTASFYGGNQVFMMIPYTGDMFEPGDIYVPISRQKDMMKHKKEIEKLISVIDVLDVYEADSDIDEIKAKKEAKKQESLNSEQAQTDGQAGLKEDEQ